MGSNKGWLEIIENRVHFVEDQIVMRKRSSLTHFLLGKATSEIGCDSNSGFSWNLTTKFTRNSGNEASKLGNHNIFPCSQD